MKRVIASEAFRYYVVYKNRFGEHEEEFSSREEAEKRIAYLNEFTDVTDVNLEKDEIV